MNDLIPTEFFLSQNYPNPFTDRTTIKYCIPNRTKVKLTVSAPGGKIREILVNEVKEPGSYEVDFSGDSINEETIFYFFLEAGNYLISKKMIQIKNVRIIK
jgi:hypothetical protein